MDELNSPGLSLPVRASEDLRCIREAMERVGSFRAVNGAGWATMGAIGLVGASVAHVQATSTDWLACWLVVGALAVPVGIHSTIRSARKLGFRLGSDVAKRFWLQLLIPLAVAAFLTGVWVDGAQWEYLAGTWLLFYGTGLMASGTWCRRPVRVGGLAFQVLGLAAFLMPGLADLWLALGFGGVHLVAGIWMVRHGE